MAELKAAEKCIYDQPAGARQRRRETEPRPLILTARFKGVEGYAYLKVSSLITHYESQSCRNCFFLS